MVKLTKEFYLPYLLHIITYWSLALIFYFADIYLNPSVYKIQGKSSKNKYDVKIFTNIIINHTLILIPLSLIHNFISQSSFLDPLPNYKICLLQLILNYFIHEIQFYCTHRLLHTHYGFKYIHKVHHEYNSPIGFSAQYAHPIEFIILFVQTTNGALILNMHPYLTCIWIILVNIVNVISHSGYKFSFYDNSYHDNHHRLFKYNYGSNQLIEKYVFGTSYNGPQISN